jgi:hypothetical protein
MDLTFRESFNAFVDERAFKLPCDPIYKETTNKAIILFKQIMICLGENKTLIQEYESTSNYLSSLDIEDAYKRGLRDGLQLHQELGMVS